MVGVRPPAPTARFTPGTRVTAVGPKSVSFDRVADRYDETRARQLTSDAGAAVVELLHSELAGRAPCLEIGVGTGLIALPLRDAGVRMMGLDLSAPMLRKLLEKTGGRQSFPLLIGDATRLPFRGDAFGGAVVRHVLHLIPDWRGAIAELVRVVRPGGALLLNIGGPGGPWEEVQDRLEAEAGPGSGRVGLASKDHQLLDDALARLGARFRGLPPVWQSSDQTLESFFLEAGQGLYSWTWNVAPERLAEAVATTRAWAFERFGRLDEVLEPRYQIVWRAYDLPA